MLALTHILSQPQVLKIRFNDLIKFFLPQMAEPIICAVDVYAKQHNGNPDFEHQFATSIENIICKKGSDTTRRRKQRAAYVLCSILAQINKAVFVCCVAGVGYTLLAKIKINNIDETIGKLRSWWTEVKDADHLSQYTTKLFDQNSERLKTLLHHSQTHQEESQVTSCGTAAAPTELTKEHDSSKFHTSVVTSQMQQEKRQVIRSSAFRLF